MSGLELELMSMSASLFIYPFSVHKLEKFHGALAKQIRQSKKPTQFPIYINFQLDSLVFKFRMGLKGSLISLKLVDHLSEKRVESSFLNR